MSNNSIDVIALKAKLRKMTGYRITFRIKQLEIYDAVFVQVYSCIRASRDSTGLKKVTRIPNHGRLSFSLASIEGLFHLPKVKSRKSDHVLNKSSRSIVKVVLQFVSHFGFWFFGRPIRIRQTFKRGESFNRCTKES